MFSHVTNGELGEHNDNKGNFQLKMYVSAVALPRSYSFERHNSGTIDSHGSFGGPCEGLYEKGPHGLIYVST